MKTDLILSIILIVMCNASWLAATSVKSGQRLFVFIASFCGSTALFKILPYVFG